MLDMMSMLVGTINLEGITDGTDNVHTIIRAVYYIFAIAILIIVAAKKMIRTAIGLLIFFGVMAFFVEDPSRIESVGTSILRLFGVTG